MLCQIKIIIWPNIWV